MTALAFLGLILLTLAWMALPLLPAIRELAWPTDVDPLGVPGRDNADVSRFARHFREYAQRNLSQLPADVATQDEYLGRLPDGTRFLRVSRLHDVLAQGALPDGSHDRLVVLEQAAELPGHERFRLELWARQTMIGGPRATYRAVLGESDVRLGTASVVLRWAHANGTLTVDEGSHLYGRTSSDTAIRLGPGVGFDRLGAPIVAVGDAQPTPLPARPEGMAPFEPPENARRLGGHLRVEGDCVVPAGTVVEGDLVVAGTLRLLEGARIAGSVKAHGQIEVQGGVVVEGSLVSRKAIGTGRGCWIRGPVISEDHVELGAGTTVGSPAGAATVSARTVTLSPDVVVCGHVVTEEGGTSAER